MKETNLALNLDRYFCGAIVVLCGIFRRFKKGAAPNLRDVREIVVSKYVGLGSILLTQKLLRVLRDSFPGARVTYLTFDRSAGILEFLKCEVDEILTVETDSPSKFLSSSFRAVSYLRKRKVDLYLDIEFFSRYSALVCFFSRPKISVGYESTMLGSRTALYSHAAKFIPQAPIVENFVNPLRSIGIEVSGEGKIPKIQLSEELLDLARGKIAALGVLSPFLVFNPSASDALGGYRRWTKSEWVRLAKIALGRNLSPIVFTGLASDRELVSGILEGLSLNERENVFNFAGEFDLREYSAFLSLSRAVVTIDSGTPHFSMALGIPTVILFGPETPALYGYDDPLCRIVYKSVYCSPCYNIYQGKKIICRNESRCMTTITAEEVFQAMEQVLVRQDPPVESELNVTKA